MKRILLLTLALLLAAGAVFGDDAKTMPKMVGRLWIAPTFGFTPGAYSSGGSYSSAGGQNGVTMLNLGFALEYGIIDWITAALQWAPGVNVWSEVDVSTAPKANANGVADLFAGAKFQIVGAAAPVAADRFRFAIGPGVKIPLPGPDYTKEYANMTAGNDATVGNVDKHVFGVGARIYFDYIFNEHFFINLYNETIFYPVKGDLDKAGVEESAQLAGHQGMDPSIKGTVDYGYNLTFELEPVFSTALGGGITFTGGLPVNYSFSPAKSYSVTGNIAQVVSSLENALGDPEPSHVLTVKPNVNFFFTTWILPTEIGLTYSIPVWGKSSIARHDITLKVKLYFALPGAL